MDSRPTAPLPRGEDAIVCCGVCLRKLVPFWCPQRPSAPFACYSVCVGLQAFRESGRQDLNLRPPGPQVWGKGGESPSRLKSQLTNARLTKSPSTLTSTSCAEPRGTPMEHATGQRRVAGGTHGQMPLSLFPPNGHFSCRAMPPAARAVPSRQGGGRWFEPSIAHWNPAICGVFCCAERLHLALCCPSERRSGWAGVGGLSRSRNRRCGDLIGPCNTTLARLSYMCRTCLGPGAAAKTLYPVPLDG